MRKGIADEAIGHDVGDESTGKIEWYMFLRGSENDRHQNGVGQPDDCYPAFIPRQGDTTPRQKSENYRNQQNRRNIQCQSVREYLCRPSASESCCYIHPRINGRKQ